jgi:hypothetical protein
VLVVGGELSGRMLDSIEEFDPSTEEWTRVATLPAPRSNHSATLLSTGRVLIVGGCPTDAIGAPSGVNATASALLYDPATRAITEGPPMAHARCGHTATVLADESVLVAGGASSQPTMTRQALAVATLERFEPSSGRWLVGPSLIAARYLHTATLLRSGQVLIAGGVDETEQGFRSAELFDPARSTVAATAGLMGELRIFFASALLPSGRVMAATGKRANVAFSSGTELFDPRDGQWTPAAAAPPARTAPTLTALPSGRLLLVGGLSRSVSRSQYVADAALFDESTGAWSAVGPLAIPRALHQATLLPSGQVLVTGGVDADGELSSCEISDQTE